MCEGRGSAVLVMVMAAMAVASHFQVAEAAFYTVGGPGGWTFNVANWPNGKRFRAGDTLIFKYTQGYHNVVRVDSGGYLGCSSSPRGAKVYQTGNDQLRLVTGQNFFICSFPGHCQSGMKIAVTAI